jgi:endonuclease/exonuclease/phosphatase family metal-dependent hydrolase
MQKKASLQLLSYNILHAQDEGIFSVIKNPWLDVVCLQEVDVTTKRKPLFSVDYLQKTSGFSCVYFRESMPYSGGFYGNAILSRIEPLQKHYIKFKAQGSEPRSALAILHPKVVGVMEEAFWVINTHLCWDK